MLVLNKSAFDRWLSRSSMICKGANDARYGLVDGRSLHRSFEERPAYGDATYTFVLGGTRRPFGEGGSSRSRILLRFSYVRGTRAEGSTELVDPVGSVLVEECRTVALDQKPEDRGKPRWGFDGDTPGRLSDSRGDRVLLEALLRQILEGVRECLEEKDIP